MGSGINNEIILVLIILCLTSGILISASVRVDLVAILVLVTIGLTGLLPPNQLFSGFSSEASISLIGVMIISYSLDNAGITVKIARWILKFGNNNPRRTSTALLIISGFLSSILRSLGTVSLFLPVANRISKRLGISKSSLLMPMAFCALLGGTLTTVGSSPMLILNSLLADAVEANNFVNANISKFKLFDIFPIGLLLLFVGVLYLTLVMPKLDEKKSKGSKISHIRNYFKKTYNKGGEVFELRVLSSCTLIGKCLREFENEMSGELSVIAIHSKSGMCFPPLRCTQILRGQDIAIMGKKQLVVDFAKRHGLQVQEKLNSFAELLHSSKSGLSESVIPPSSQFVGQEVRELHMRRNHALNVLALLRGDKIYTGAALDSVVLRTGDTLGMYSQWQALNEFREQP
ncbi:MAG: SLC13 family permease, partial [Francisellaceae bacterium]|nr:SLC13 family permease [Francisellaceae bacterium]